MARKTRTPETGPRRDSPLSQEEWEALRQQPGETEIEWRRRSQRAASARCKAKDPERRKAVQQRYVETHRDEVRARNRAWNAAHPDRTKVAADAYHDRHRDRRYAAHRRWVLKNREVARALARNWSARNPGRNAFRSALWRRQARIATPPWADLEAIRLIYEQAARISVETGVAHHVDHHYPLRGETVSGLHVETNLEIILATANAAKRNRHPDD